MEKYFCDIVDAISSAEKILPKSKPKIGRDYWSRDLSDLKQASYDAFILWRDVGGPSSGPIFDEKKNSSYRYKCAVRKAKRNFDQAHCDKIHEDLLSNNNNRFWRS